MCFVLCLEVPEKAGWESSHYFLDLEMQIFRQNGALASTGSVDSPLQVFRIRKLTVGVFLVEINKDIPRYGTGSFLHILFPSILRHSVNFFFKNKILLGLARVLASHEVRLPTVVTKQLCLCDSSGAIAHTDSTEPLRPRTNNGPSDRVLDLH